MTTNIRKWQIIKEKRDARLISCDWTQFPDSPFSDAKRAEWITYRQSLRNIPNTLRGHSDYVSDSDSDPFQDLGTWSWPTKPS